MASYFQMGHDMENLVGETDLNDFSGIVLSPVNRSPQEMSTHITKFREIGNFDIVLDPQLYFPRSDRGKLQEHPHFPSDFESADLSDIIWWRKQADILASHSLDLGVTSVTSPAFIPSTWSHEFYSLCAEVAAALKDILAGTSTSVLTSVVVGTNDLTNEQKPFEIASILSGKASDGYYVVFVSDVEPRREMTNSDILFGMLSLVRELRASGRPVLVSHCSSDMVLFKYAQADHCATGKFFNLRRFTKSRYDEPSGGGGQLPYWFEQSLFAFLRGADLLRLQKGGFESLVGYLHSRNTWGEKILQHFNTTPDMPWLGLSWRQYLSWFARAEAELSTSPALASEWLSLADKNWLELDKGNILFDERQNNGEWIRSWRQSLIRLDIANE